MTQGTSTDRVRENGFKQVEYKGHNMWMIAGSVQGRSAYGNVDNHSGYKVTEYTSYGSVNGVDCFINDQYMTYLDGGTIAAHYESDDALYEELITWPLNIYEQQADEGTASMSELQTYGSYTYQTLSMVIDGQTRTIMIAVNQVDENEVEIIMMDIDDGADSESLSMLMQQW